MQQKELVDFPPEGIGEQEHWKTYMVYGKYSLMTLPVDGWFYHLSIYFCVTQ